MGKGFFQHSCGIVVENAYHRLGISRLRHISNCNAQGPPLTLADTLEGEISLDLPSVDSNTKYEYDQLQMITLDI